MHRHKDSSKFTVAVKDARTLACICVCDCDYCVSKANSFRFVRCVVVLVFFLFFGTLKMPHIIQKNNSKRPKEKKKRNLLQQGLHTIESCIVRYGHTHTQVVHTQHSDDYIMLLLFLIIVKSSVCVCLGIFNGWKNVKRFQNQMVDVINCQKNVWQRRIKWKRISRSQKYFSHFHGLPLLVAVH